MFQNSKIIRLLMPVLRSLASFSCVRHVVRGKQKEYFFFVTLCKCIKLTLTLLSVNASSLCPKEKLPLAFSASSGGKPASIITNEMNEQLHETSINWRSLATCLGISDDRRPKKSRLVTSNLTFDGSGSNTLFGLTLTGLFLKRQCKVTPVIPS